ncbi:zinc finger MYM-type protein 1-like [Aphis gossypii]|uniref:zinc finger MYM-type protein 1-like n=1 Tax=Aphis gossypii TaxID=80765 RepID=UPI002159A9D7|nr:zinc finger MYM-type protein 1-like [Aphis gossypii]
MTEHAIDVYASYTTLVIAVKKPITPRPPPLAAANPEYAHSVVLHQRLLNMMKTPTFVFHLFIFHEVLKIINILSKQLQQKNTNLSNATNTINGVIKTFEEMRNNDHFSGIWDKISNFAYKNDISLDIPKINTSILESKRQRTEPYHLRDFNVTVVTGAEQQLPIQCTETVDKQIQNYWRNHFYNPIVDTILSHLKLRFSEESQELAQDLFSINLECLKSEMTVARNCAIQLSNKFGLKELKQVISKTVYPNLFKLLQVALVLPISSASCERSFSAMRRIKSWTRTTMGQERLSYLTYLTYR